MFRFLHASDLHLDVPFRALRRAPSSVSEVLQDASFEAFERLVDVALEREVAFVLLAGDTFRSPSPSIRAQVALITGLERLAKAGIRTFITRGTDEVWVDAQCPVARPLELPEGVTVFGDRPSSEVVRDANGTALATIHGTGALPLEGHQGPVFRELASRATEGLGIGLSYVHASNERIDTASPPLGPYTETEDLLGSPPAKGPIQYWALGRFHRHEILRREPSWIVYPGTTQGRSLHSGEVEAKGVVVVEVDDGDVASVTFEPTDRVRLTELRVELHVDAGVDSCRTRFLDALAAYRKSHPSRALVVDGVLVTHKGDDGEGRLLASPTASRATGLSKDGAPSKDRASPNESRAATSESSNAVRALLASLRRESEGSYPIAWWNRIRVVSDRSPFPSVHGIEGDFARDLRAVTASCADSPSRLDELVGRDWGSFESTEVDDLPRLSIDDQRDLIVQAEREALELLREESQI